MTAAASPPAPAGEGVAGAPAGGRRRSAALFAVAAVVYVAVGVVQYAPAVRQCSTTVVAPPGDATAGAVWLGWNWRRGGPPWRATTDTIGGSGEDRLWQPAYATSAAGWVMPLWTFSRLTNEVCGYNLTVLFGHVLTALAAYLAVWILTRCFAAGLFAGAAYGFSSFLLTKAEVHVGYLYAFAFPLLIVSCLWLWRSPGWRSALATGGVLALACYGDPYYLLFAPVLAVSLVVGGLVASLAAGDRPRARRTALAAAGAGGVVLVLVAPLAIVFARTDGGGVTTSGRNLQALRRYSARPSEYLLPSPEHPLAPTAYVRLREARRHGSNRFETNLFVGWTVLALAVLAVVVAFRRRGAPPQPGPLLGLPYRPVVAVLAAATAVAVVFSGPPELHVLGLRIPTPSGLVYRVVSAWRVYARFFLVVHACLVVLAGLGLAVLLRRLHGRWRVLVGALVVLAVLAEMLVAPRPTFAYDDAPAVYRWLSRRSGRVAEYPLLTPLADPDNRYLTFQPVHGRPLVQTTTETSRWTPVLRPLLGLGDAATVPVLRTLGVRWVVVHPDLYVVPPPHTTPAGLREVRTFRAPRGSPAAVRPFADATVYEVRPGPEADLALGLGDGFFDGEADGSWDAWNWMGDSGHQVVRRLRGDSTSARVSFNAGTLTDSRRLTIRDGPRVLWQGTVDRDTAVTFDAPVGRDLTLDVTPKGRRPTGADPGNPDRRILGLVVRDPVAVAL